MNSWVPSQRRLWSGLAVGVIGPLVIAGIVLPARGQVDGAVVALALLVPTAIGAALGGPVAALVAVVGGSVTHNVLFTEPYMTLRVTETVDVVELTVHAVVAVVVSLVVVREQRAARLAAVHGEQAARVHVLEEVDRTRTALLGAVSHDLRTPLSAIAAAASELQASDVSFSEVERGVLANTIVEQAARLDRTVANLLDAGRLHSDAVRISREAVEVEDVVVEALAGLGEARERVHLRVGRGTPPVLVDPVLMVAAIRNLLDNALRHGPEGTPVEVEAAPAGGAVVLVVRDHGPGIGEVPPSRLFTPFQTQGGDGTGLGLAITRGFVEAHGGQVRAMDAEGGGGLFEVVLPAVREPVP